MPAPEITARELLVAHRRTFHTFWTWNQRFVDTAMLRNSARTVFGWPARIDVGSNPRAIANFPMQANGAEMMRIACCLAVERGIEVCAPVHDAVLIAAPVNHIDEAVATMQTAMAEASRAVLNGFELGTDAKIVRPPDRYMDERPGSREMWDRIWSMVEDEERKSSVSLRKAS
jgi:DNA polymerase I